MRSEGWGSKRDRVRAAAVIGALTCLAVFGMLRVALVRQQQHLGIDEWVAERLHAGEPGSRLVDLLEQAASMPGSRRGAAVEIVAITAWAWLARRDLRWSVLIVAAFTGTTSTVALVKLGFFEPIIGDLERAYLSEHAANGTAVFGMLILILVLDRIPIQKIVLAGGAAAIIVTTIAVAMMAGGHHWLTDVISGGAVAGVWISALTPAAYELWHRPDLIQALRLDDGGSDHRAPGIWHGR